MALIICPECGRSVSDKAQFCIGCGFPIKEHLKQEIEEKIELATSDKENKRCFYCNSENIDEEGYCNFCGMKNEVIQESTEMSKNSSVPREWEEHTICPQCNQRNHIGVWRCVKCNYSYKLDDYIVQGGSPKKRCPACGSLNFYTYVDKVVTKKVKMKTSFNLNPLKPFTIFNHRMKPLKIAKQTCFVCNDCGKIF